MAKLTPEEAAGKWASRLAGASEEIRRGVERVSTPPGVAAARQADKYQRRVVAAVPKWQQRVAAVSLPEWQRATIEKGVPRVASGAQAAEGKMAGFMAELLPFQDRLRSQIDGMPSTTLEDGIQRATAWMRGQAQFRRGGAR